MQQVKDYPLLERDVLSKALLNTDKSGYQQALRRRANIKRNNERYDALENKVKYCTTLLEELLLKLNK